MRTLGLSGRIVLSGLIVALGGGDLRAEIPAPILLWPAGAPDAVGQEDVDQPTIGIYRPTSPNGAAIVVCPGGGYGTLATDHEGHQIAQWLTSIGVTGIVLKYRLGPRYHHPAPLQDVSRAIRTVRAMAADLQVSPHRVGVMGFSAGGHLASTVSTHYDAGDPSSQDPVERQSSRPDFTILGYPVISLRDAHGHRGSARNLLGENPDPELITLLCNDEQVTADTPPAFLFHTNEDSGVLPDNSLAYFAALRKHGVAGELHIYQHGPHGVGLGVADPVTYTWKERLADWLQTNGLLADVKRVEVSGTVTYGGEPMSWGAITFVPLDGKQLPIAGDRIRQGQFKIPAHRGVVVGRQQVIIRTLGTVDPRPTLDAVVTLTGPGTDRNIEVTVGAAGETLTFDF